MSHYASPAAAFPSAAAAAGRPWTDASPVPVRDRSCGGKEQLLLVVLALAAVLVLGSFALQFQWVHREPTDVSLQWHKFASRIPIEAELNTPPAAAATVSSSVVGGASIRHPPSLLASLAATPTPRRSPELRVLTYATHAGYKFCWLLSSCQAQELPLVALGWHTTKKGLGYKLTSTLQYLDTLPAGDLVLFVDAFDAVVTRPASEMIHLFESLNADLVFSAEKGCWPYVALPQGEQLCRFYYPPSPTMYRFVNTGSWMGRVGAARKLLRDIQTAHASEALGELNDQELVTDFFVCDYLQQLYKEGGDAAVLQRVGHVFGDTDAKKAAARIPGCNRLDGVVKYGVKLDYECVLFQSLHNSEIDQSIHAPQVMEIHVSFDAANGTWQNINTGSHPAVFHFNGGGKLHIDRIWEKVKKRQPDDSHSLSQYDVDTKKYAPLDFQEVCEK